MSERGAQHREHLPRTKAPQPGLSDGAAAPQLHTLSMDQSSPSAKRSQLGEHSPRPKRRRPQAQVLTPGMSRSDVLGFYSPAALSPAAATPPGSIFTPVDGQRSVALAAASAAAMARHQERVAAAMVGTPPPAPRLDVSNLSFSPLTIGSGSPSRRGSQQAGSASRRRSGKKGRPAPLFLARFRVKAGACLGFGRTLSPPQRTTTIPGVYTLPPQQGPAAQRPPAWTGSEMPLWATKGVLSPRRQQGGVTIPRRYYERTGTAAAAGGAGPLAAAATALWADTSDPAQGSRRRDRGHLRAGPVLQGPLAASWAATAAATAAGAETIPQPSHQSTTVERTASAERPAAVASAVGPAPNGAVPRAPHPPPLTPSAVAPLQPPAEAAAHFQRQLPVEAEAMQAEADTQTDRFEAAAAAPTVSDQDEVAGTEVAAPTGTGGVLPNDEAGRRRSRAAAARRGLPHAYGFRRASRTTGGKGKARAGRGSGASAVGTRAPAGYFGSAETARAPAGYFGSPNAAGPGRVSPLPFMLSPTPLRTKFGGGPRACFASKRASGGRRRHSAGGEAPFADPALEWGALTTDLAPLPPIDDTSTTGGAQAELSAPSVPRVGVSRPSELLSAAALKSQADGRTQRQPLAPTVGQSSSPPVGSARSASFSTATEELHAQQATGAETVSISGHAVTSGDGLVAMAADDEAFELYEDSDMEGDGPPLPPPERANEALAASRQTLHEAPPSSTEGGDQPKTRVRLALQPVRRPQRVDQKKAHTTQQLSEKAFPTAWELGVGQENVLCGPRDALMGSVKGRRMVHLPPVPQRALGGKAASSLLNAGPSAKRPHLASDSREPQLSTRLAMMR